MTKRGHNHLSHLLPAAVESHKVTSSSPRSRLPVISLLIRLGKQQMHIQALGPLRSEEAPGLCLRPGQKPWRLWHLESKLQDRGPFSLSLPASPVILHFK